MRKHLPYLIGWSFGALIVLVYPNRYGLLVGIYVFWALSAIANRILSKENNHG